MAFTLKQCYIYYYDGILNPKEILIRLADDLKSSRVANGLTQKELALKSNVSVSVLRKFEQTGRISLESFIKLPYTLGFEDVLLALFKRPSSEMSIDAILKQKKTKKRVKPFKPRKPRS